MVFRFYSSQLSQATRSISAWIFVAGMMLFGLGLLVLLLRDIFIFVAAGLFFVAGLGVMWYAVKLFFASRRMGKPLQEASRNARRENVKIHESQFEQQD
jgi:cobalamin biosynthesis protein CobD/CbiB